MTGRLARRLRKRSEPAVMTHLFSAALLLVGIAGMYLVAVSNQPIDVAADDCVRYWNDSSDIAGLGLPVHQTLALFAENELELGYGLCTVAWQVNGRCLDVMIQVTKETTSWADAVLSSCETAAGGTQVVLDAQGGLAFGK